MAKSREMCILCTHTEKDVLRDSAGNIVNSWPHHLHMVEKGSY